MARVYLKNYPQLRAKLQKLRDDTAADVAPAMAKAAQDIVDMMQRLVPVNSGELRESIGFTFGAAPKYAQKVTSASFGATTVTIFAGNSRVRYAHLVEFGTAAHINGGLFAGSQHPGTTPKPFFFVSYRALKKEAAKMIRKAIKDAVKRAVA